MELTITIKISLRDSRDGSFMAATILEDVENGAFEKEVLGEFAKNPEVTGCSIRAKVGKSSNKLKKWL